MGLSPAKGLPCVGSDLGVSSPNWSSCRGTGAGLSLPQPHPQTAPRDGEQWGRETGGSWVRQLSQSPSGHPGPLGPPAAASRLAGGSDPDHQAGASGSPAYQLLGWTPTFLEHALGLLEAARLELPHPGWEGISPQ